MMKSIIVAIGSIFMTMVLIACSDAPQMPPSQAVQYQTQQPVQQPVQPPVVVQESSSGVGTALAGAAIGAAAGYGIAKMTQDKQPQYRETYREPQRSYYSAPAQQAPTIVTPVQKPSVAPAQVFKPQAAKSASTVTPMRSSSSGFRRRR